MLARGRALVASYWTPAGKRALGNLIGLVVCTGLSQGLLFLQVLLTAQAFPQQDYAAIVVAFSVQSFLFVIGSAGLNGVIVRDLHSEGVTRDRRVIAYLAGVFGVSSFIGVTVVVGLSAFRIESPTREALTLLAIGNVFACLNLSPLYDAGHRAATAAALSLPCDAIPLMVTWVGIQTGHLSVAVVCGGHVARWAGSALLHAVVYHRTIQPFRPRAIVPRDVSDLLRTGLPLLAGGVLYLIPLQGGVVATRLLRDESDAAVFGLSMQIALTYLTVAGFLGRILQPHVVGAYGLHRGFIRKLVLATVGLHACLWAGGLAGCWVLTRHVLRPEYRPAFGVTVVLFAGVSAAGVALVGQTYLFRFHRERVLLPIFAAAAGVFVVCVFALREGTLPTFASATTASLVALAVLTLTAVGWTARTAGGVDQAAGRKM